ncbi:MAG: hypothetical protein IKG25_05385 [Mogibacterium sp.]|nr:hypothetical protein [Mogibacterium sp.]
MTEETILKNQIVIMSALYALLQNTKKSEATYIDDRIKATMTFLERGYE